MPAAAAWRWPCSVSPLVTCLFENTMLSAVPAMWLFNHPFSLCETTWSFSLNLCTWVDFVSLGPKCGYDSGLTNESIHSPRPGDGFKDGQVAHPEAMRRSGISAGYPGREANVFPLDSLPAAILPLHRASSWDHLGKNRVKRRRMVTSFGPLGLPYNWNQPILEIFSHMNQHVLFSIH